MNREEAIELAYGRAEATWPDLLLSDGVEELVALYDGIRAAADPLIAYGRTLGYDRTALEAYDDGWNDAVMTLGMGGYGKTP